MSRPGDTAEEFQACQNFQELPNLSDRPFGEEFARSALRGRFGSRRGLQKLSTRGQQISAVTRAFSELPLPRHHATHE